jgi:hypothetical protein
MFTNLQATFVMFSLCYAQWPSYLHCTIFPSPGILQHYIEFDAYTIAMLEKLLGSKSFGTIVGHLVHCHSSCFFSGARFSWSGLMCYFHLFKMLGFDRSYTSFSYLTRWSPYSPWCNGTCKYWKLSLPCHIAGYLCNVIWSCSFTCFAFQKYNSVILSSNAILFDGPITWARIYFVYNRCSFECHAPMSLLLCKSSNRAWLLVCLSTLSLCLSSTHFLTTLCISLGIPHPIIPHLSWC